MIEMRAASARLSSALSSAGNLRLISEPMIEGLVEWVAERGAAKSAPPWPKEADGALVGALLEAGRGCSQSEHTWR